MNLLYNTAAARVQCAGKMMPVLAARRFFANGVECEKVDVIHTSTTLFGLRSLCGYVYV